jgi:hypothetical protein
MEEKINVAEILKDKPKGTKLYSDICCGECFLNEVSENAIYVDMYNKERFWYFSVYGTIYAFPNGGVLLYPSKEMRDWSKFSWKKGDVLVNKDESVHIIFEKFEDDAYKNFHGQYYLWEEGGMVSFEEDENYMQTSDFNKANKEDAQEYIHKIEKILGGKLNRETLEIEKTQPEFKDGDIVFMKGIKSELFANCIFILKGEYKDGDERAFYYAFYNVDDKFTEAEYGNTKVHYSLRSATDSEKQQLFDALAKKGKTWDAEKKQIVDLKPKVEFKPFDKVLVRNTDTEEWFPGFFEKFDSTWNYPYHIMNRRSMTDFAFKQCIPYEGNEHLLGTTKNVEG